MYNGERVGYRCLVVRTLAAIGVLLVLERSMILWSIVDESTGRKNSVIMETFPCLSSSQLSRISSPSVSESTVSSVSSTLSRLFPSIDTNNAILSSSSTLLEPIQKIHVLGERNSGTKYVGKLLRSAFRSRYSTPGPKDHLSKFTTEYERNIPILKIKHMFRHRLLNSTEINQLSTMGNALWLLVVRNPCDWADAMYRKPWHLCPTDKSVDWCANQTKIDLEDQTLGMTRDHFLQKEWSDWQEVKQVDKNVTTSYSPYRNIFQLRTHKLNLMLQLMRLHPHNVRVVHLNDISKRPDVFLSDLIRDFELEVSPRFNMTASRQRSKPKMSICLPGKEWRIAQRDIDWELEAHFGFHQLDCRLCVLREAAG